MIPARSVIAAALALGLTAAPALARHRGDAPTGGTLQALSAPVALPAFGPAYHGTPGARAPERLDASAAVAYALANAPSLLNQRAAVEQADSVFAKARAQEYPSSTGTLQNQTSRSGNSSGQFAQFGITPENNFSQNTAELSGSYFLYNGTRQITAEQAKKQWMAAQYELARQRNQMVASVATAFYGLAADRALIVLDRNDLAYQQALLASALAEERVGRVAGVDVLKAQVAVARSSATLVQAQADEANARQTLALQIGAPAGSDFAIPDPLPEPGKPSTPLATLLTMAKINRPEIASARASLDAAKLTDADIDSDLRPTVQLSGSFGSQVSPTSFVNAQRQIDASNAAAVAAYIQERTLFPNVSFPLPTFIPPVDRHVPGFWQFQIVSQFSIPLYDFGQRAAAHHAARAQIDSSLAGLFNAYDTVEADVSSSARNLDAAAQKLVLAKQSAQLGRESARIAQLQYKYGLISLNDATQTEQTAFSAESDLVSARVGYVTALIKLRVALAPPSPAAAADLRGL